MGRLNPEFVNMLYRVPVLLLSFMTHELSHAFVAYRFGDNTAKEAGRISFNPLKHIDPIGALMMIATRFGWAKPVPINPNNFKNKKAGIVVTSLAGPVSNILLATVFCCAEVVLIAKARPAPFIPLSGAAEIALNLFEQFIIVNISLAAFNLIPVPPLDGSKVLLSILPDKLYYNYVLRYERYGMFILIGLMVTGVLPVILNPIIYFLYDMIVAVSESFSALL